MLIFLSEIAALNVLKTTIVPSTEINDCKASFEDGCVRHETVMH